MMLRFIHLSDIHFSNRKTSFGFDPDSELRNRVISDIKSMTKKLGKATAVLVTGDVAYHGRPAEYKDAAGWLDLVCDAAECDRQEVLICPGNHDIDQSVIRENQLIQDGHEAIRRAESVSDCSSALDQRLSQTAARSLFYAPLEAYNEFAARYSSSFFADENNFVWERDFPLSDGSSLRIRGLNSALLSGTADKKGNMYLGPRAVTFSRQDGVEYLTMSHHPPNWLLDEREVASALEDEVRVQLFGHEHESRVMLGRDWVKLFAGAVSPHRAEPNWRPGYNIIELEIINSERRCLQVNVHAREWQGRPPQFRAIEDRENDPVHRATLPLKPLPETWISPWQQGHASEGNNGGDGEMEDAAYPAQAVEAAAARHGFRALVYRFFRLSFSQKSQIVGTLQLIKESDRELPDLERFKLQLMRAHETGRLDALEEIIAKMEICV